MPLTMQSMKAFRTVGDKKAKVLDHDLPVPAEQDIFVAVKSIGLNPTDWKHVAFISEQNVGVGCDFAGVVEYDAHGFKKGDRVAGFVHGGAYEHQGSFAEYLVTDHKQVFRIPDSVSFDEAATYGIAYITACMALYSKLKLSGPLEGKKSDETVFVYGGSSAVGIQAIQLAKLSGYHVVAAASSKNFDLLKKLGADECFDYKDKDVVEHIKSATKNNLKYCLDTISEEASFKISPKVLAKGGQLVVLLPPPKDLKSDVEVDMVLAYSGLGKSFSYGPFSYDSDTEMKTLAENAYVNLTKLLEEKKIQTAPLKVIDGGLNGIQEAFDYMSSGKVSAQKLVLHVSDTA